MAAAWIPRDSFFPHRQSALDDILNGSVDIVEKKQTPVPVGDSRGGIVDNITNPLTGPVTSHADRGGEVDIITRNPPPDETLPDLNPASPFMPYNPNGPAKPGSDLASPLDVKPIAQMPGRVVQNPLRPDLATGHNGFGWRPWDPADDATGIPPMWMLAGGFLVLGGIIYATSK